MLLCSFFFFVFFSLCPLCHVAVSLSLELRRLLCLVQYLVITVFCMFSSFFFCLFFAPCLKTTSKYLFFLSFLLLESSLFVQWLISRLIICEHEKGRVSTAHTHCKTCCTHFTLHSSPFGRSVVLPHYSYVWFGKTSTQNSFLVHASK